MTHKLNLSGFNLALCFALVGAFLMLAIDPAFAGNVSAGLPWEGALQKIQDSLTGPVALAIALVGIAITGGLLMFGGEMNAFGRSALMIGLAGSILLSANSLVQTLFSRTAGALL